MMISRYLCLFFSSWFKSRSVSFFHMWSQNLCFWRYHLAAKMVQEIFDFYGCLPATSTKWPWILVQIKQINIWGWFSLLKHSFLGGSGVPHHNSWDWDIFNPEFLHAWFPEFPHVFHPQPINFSVFYFYITKREFQVPKTEESWNLFIRLFWGWDFPYISLTYSLYRWVPAF